MRNTVIVLIAIMTVVMIGCNRKKEIVKRYPPGTSPRTSSTQAPKGLNRAGGPVDEKADEEKADEAAEDDQNDEKDDAKSDDAKSDEEATSTVTTAPPPRTGTSAGRIGRRRSPGLNRAGGGAVADSNESVTPPPAPEEKPDESDVASNDQPTPPPIEEPDDSPAVERKSFFEKAVVAFKNENENEAFQYLYAYALTEDGALNKHPVQWYEGLKEPRIGLRWGVGIQYNKGRFDGDPPQIGDPVDESGNQSGRGRGGNAGDTAAGGPGSSSGARSLGGNRGRGVGNRSGGGGSSSSDQEFEDPVAELEYYTGDFGRMFVNRFEEKRKHKNAYYGQALKDVDLDASFDTSDNTASTRTPPPAAGSDMATVSDTSRPRGRSRNRDTSADDEPEYEADPTSLAPGLMMLGVGNRSSLFEAAQANNLDLLVIFDVKIDHSAARNKTTTKAKMYLYLVKNGENADSLAATKTLSNVAVWKARDGGSSNDDPIGAQLDRIFEEVTDKDFIASDFPDWIDSETAAQRADYLVGMEHENPLPILVEFKALHEAGLLSKDKYINVVELLVGPDKAKDLIDGDVTARDLAIHQWLPGQFDLDTASN